VKDGTLTTQWADTFPEVASTWHPSRNGNLTAGKVGRSWPAKVWWRCPAGHEWEEQVNTRLMLPQWKGGDRAACRECTGSPLTLVSYTYPECGCTRNITQKNRDKQLARCWHCEQAQRDEQWQQAAATARKSGPQAAELVEAIERDYLSPDVPAPLAWEFHRHAMRFMQGAIGAEQARVKPGAIGGTNGQLRALARSLPPTIEEATAAAGDSGVLRILDQAHWAAGWVHHLSCTEPHPVSQDDLDDAAHLVAQLTEDAATLIKQQGMRTADITGILTHAIAELPRRVQYKYKSDNKWRTYRELRLPVLRPGAVRYGRLDLVIWHPEFTDIVVEIDSAPNPDSARKLEFARDAGAFAIWVRHGSGGISAPGGVAVIDLRGGRK
jgi:hypothetical protein